MFNWFHAWLIVFAGGYIPDEGGVLFVSCSSMPIERLESQSDGESDLQGISLEKLSAEPPALMKKPCRKKAGQKGHKKKESTKVRKKVVVKRLKAATKMPAHGMISHTGVLCVAKVPLKKVGPLNLKVVCSLKPGKN